MEEKRLLKDFGKSIWRISKKGINVHSVVSKKNQIEKNKSWHQPGTKQKNYDLGLLKDDFLQIRLSLTTSKEGLKML